MPRVERVCQVCQVVFWIVPSKARAGAGKFCSKACRMQGRLLGLTTGGAGRTRYHWEPWMDALLLARYDSQPATLDTLAQQIPFPRASIAARAQRLGVARTRGPAWTEAEVDYVHTHLGAVALPVMARALGRTETAIALVARRRGINKTTSGGYTARSLLPLLGWRTARVKSLVERGWLVAARRHMAYADSRADAYLITDEALYHCLLAHPDLIDLRRVDKAFFLDLITRGAFTKARLKALRSA